MSLRDQHMRAKIFAAGDALPELKFTASKIQCPSPDAAKESACQVQGNFTLRGISKPFAIALKVRPAAQGTYKITGKVTSSSLPSVSNRPANWASASRMTCSLSSSFKPRNCAR